MACVLEADKLMAWAAFYFWFAWHLDILTLPAFASGDCSARIPLLKTSRLNIPSPSKFLEVNNDGTEGN